MQIRATYTTPDWVRAYYTIWQGILSLTEKEVDLLCLIGQRCLLLQEKVLDKDLLAEMLLSTPARQQMRGSLSMSTNHFQNTLTSLVGKNALAKDELGNYHLSNKLVPQKELIFSFTIHD